MHRYLLVVLASVLAGSALSLSIGVQSVSASCSPSRPDQDFAGYAGTMDSPTVAPDGIKADIEEYQPWVTDGSEVTGWVMLNSGTSRWAQVGWIRSKDGGVYTRQVFVQYTNNAGTPVTSFWAGQSGTTNYRVDWDPAGDTFSFRRGGTIIATATLSWDVTDYQVFGETHRKSDQMPGGTTAHMDFTNTYMSPVGSASWFSLTSPVFTNQGTWYGALRVNSVRYEVWDKECSS